MPGRRLPLTVILGGFLWIALSLIPAAGQKSPTLTKETDINAVRLAVANGVIEYVNNARRAQIDLEWELLPLDSALQQEARAQGVRPKTIRIENNRLGDPTRWIENIPAGNRQFVQEALFSSTLAAYSLDDSNTRFQNQWVNEAGAGRQLLNPPAAMAAPQYFGLLRDHYQITGLLASKGITYTIDVIGAMPRRPLPITSDGSDISWVIQIYKFAAKAGSVYYYRFAAKAIVRRFELTFPNTSDSEAKLDVGIDIRRSDATIGVLEPNLRSLPGSLTVKLDPAREEELKRLKEENAESQLETTLRFIGGGAELGAIVSSGLLGGTSDASIIAGGLVGQGRIGQVIGVNREFRPAAGFTPGILFGIDPSGDRSLFLGPSLRFSVFTVAAGIQTFEEDRRTSAGFGGVVSVDLSRATGAKRTTQKIQLDNSVTGGDWGKASDLISRDLALVKWSLAGDSANAGFTLVQIEDAAGNSITESAKRARFDFTVAQNAVPAMMFIPRGRYRYEGIAEGSRLRTSALAFVRNGSEVQIQGRGLVEINWRLEPNP